MRLASIHKTLPFSCRAAVLLAAVVLAASSGRAQTSGSESSNSRQSQQDPSVTSDKNLQDRSTQSKKDAKPSDPTTTKLRIHVTAADKPVGNASVYVRFPVTGGLFHKDKLAELNLKTNEDGSSCRKGLEDLRQVVRRRFRRADRGNKTRSASSLVLEALFRRLAFR
jgi:hypothetical protein